MHLLRLRPRTRAMGIIFIALTLILVIFGQLHIADAAPIRKPGPSGVNHPHILRTRQTSKHSSSTQPPLIYNNGPVMRVTSTSYAIFWEPSTLQDGAPTQVSPTYNSLIQRYFNDVGGSGLYNIDTQYNDSGGNIVNSSTFGGAWLDTSPYPPSDCNDWATPDGCINDANIQAEVARAMSTNNWTAGLNHLFFVFTSKNEGTCADAFDCSFAQFCAYHYYFTANNQNILYANMPYTGTNLSSCGVATSPNNDFNADSTINVISHEHMEAVTDPLITAWIDSTGAEIGDKCAWNFGTLSVDGNQANVQWNGHYYIVQQEWSNAVSACALIGQGGQPKPGNSVYVGSDDGNIYALNATNGSLLWRYQTDKAVVSSPVAAAGVVYAGSKDHYVYALSASAGTLLWRYQTGNAIYSSPAVAAKVVYIGSNDSYMYALNASSGALLWRFKTDRPVMSMPVVVNSVVYVSSSNGSTYALNASSGKLNWRYQTRSASYAAPTIAGNVVYAGSTDGYIYALNASNGKLSWRTQLGSYIARAPVVANGVIYAGSFDSNVYALNIRGALLWHYQTGGEVNTSPTAANGLVYVGAWDGLMYAINATRGTLSWSYNGDRIDSSSTVAGGAVYFGAGDGYLYALDATNGALKWSYQTKGAVESSPTVTLPNSSSH